MGNHARNLDALKLKYPTATFIKNWTELALIPKESKSHTLQIEDCSAWLISKTPEKYSKNKSYDRQIEHTDHYLSTHAFYGHGTFIQSTKILQLCGFNVVLDNWDALEEDKKDK